MKVKTGLYIAVVAFLGNATAHGAVDYLGGIYSQNFNTLPNTPQNQSFGNSPLGWTDDNAAPDAGNFSIPGWYLYHPTSLAEGGFNGRQRMQAGAGTSSNGAFMSYGPAGSTERALGMLGDDPVAGANAASFYGARFTNTSGVTLTRLTLSYTGEQWHSSGANGLQVQTTTFDYKVTSGAALIQDPGFTDVPALDFTSPTGGFPLTALDGNAAQNRVVKGPITVSGLGWAPGQDLWIRWTDLNGPGFDHGLAIDDLSLAAFMHGDFDDDFEVDLADYLNLSTNLHTNVSTLPPPQAYIRGDMTGDLLIDGRDFVAFRIAYDNANGLGAFVAMIGAIPEPSASLLGCLGLGVLGFAGVRGRRTGWRRRRVPRNV